MSERARAECTHAGGVDDLAGDFVSDGVAQWGAAPGLAASAGAFSPAGLPAAAG